ncbi:MAG: TIM barrel protein [Phycisphaeraceae bacterium]|nr:TIM barrel protein [Phycisphaeraceae bacterium]
MLLTLAASSFRAMLRKDRAGAKSLKLTDLPRFTREQLGLFGLNLSTDLLVGMDLSQLDQLRDAADKASCPCLVLIETDPQPFGFADDRADAAVERMIRVARAANRLGCNAAAVSVAADDTDDCLSVAADALKVALRACDKLEINLLLAPHKGLTENPDRLTELIKKVGGFRIGTFPDFQTASLAPDPISYLRRLTPYAAAVSASCVSFTSKKGEVTHAPYDLMAYTQTVASVGYTGTLAIDFRGEGDPAAAIAHARDTLDAAIGGATLELPDE